MKYYTLESLGELNVGEEKPARYAVIGNPVAHSLSPQLHQPALDKMGIDGRYVRVEVRPGEVDLAFQKMREAGIEGINVTVPHKLEALEACDEVGEGAMLMGAVNTIVFEGEKRGGFNTDGPGFVRAIKEDFEVDVSGLKVCIVGAGGGAGRAIATQCVLEDCEGLVLANRSLGKLEEMKKELASRSESELKIFSLDEPDLEEAVGNSDLIVNTTSLGLKESDPSPVPVEWISQGQMVYDTIYKRTALLVGAEKIGAKTAGGLSLLLHQGVLALEKWVDREVPVEAMREGLERAVGWRQETGVDE